MTKEELLRPRYKVIADWPRENKYDSLVGTIYTLPDLSNEIPSATPGILKNHLEDWCAYYDHYPHLFKPLQWWVERKPEDMPEYVENIHSKAVRKVTEWDQTGIVNGLFYAINYDEEEDFIALDYIPATLEEYQSSQKVK